MTLNSVSKCSHINGIGVRCLPFLFICIHSDITIRILWASYSQLHKQFIDKKISLNFDLPQYKTTTMSVSIYAPLLFLFKSYYGTITPRAFFFLSEKTRVLVTTAKEKKSNKKTFSLHLFLLFLWQCYYVRGARYTGGHNRKRHYLRFVLCTNFRLKTDILPLILLCRRYYHLW